MKTSTRRRLLAALALLLLAVVAAPPAGTWWLTRPCRRAIGEGPAELAAVDVTVALDDGTRLAGWEIDVERPRAAVLVLHGRGSSRAAMAERARLLKEAACASLLLDLPGHGESEGDVVTLGAREAAVAAAGFARLRERWPGAPRGAIGLSMGGAALCLAAPTLDARFVVLESAYATLDDAIGGRVERFFGPVAPLLVPLAAAAYRASTGIDPAGVRPVDRIGELRAPLLLLHGRLDPSTRFDQAEALFAAAREPKRLVAFEDAGHVDLCKRDPEHYRATLLAFLDEALPR